MLKKIMIMKPTMKIVPVALFLCAVMTACKKDTVDLTVPPVGLGGDTWAQDSTDTFIYDSLTVPYNIAVYWKWDPGQLDFPADIVPPEESKVIPMLKGLLNVCFAAYNEQTGSETFLRHYLPKTYELAGSAEYEPNGSIILGQAEQGTAMLLYLVNYYSRLVQDSATFKQLMHTMHHEFGHILHQNVLYPAAYKTITAGYNANWFNVAEADARVAGFITSYAEAAPNEDFVEMIATMLAGGPDGPDGGYDEYEQLLTQTGGPGTSGYAEIKAKEAIVVNYFQQVWNIDFYALRAECRTLFVNYLQ